MQKEVSIVTDIPGTTRDVVRDDALIEGITFRILDTAGIRKARNEIELEGVKRALSEAEQADIILNLVDLTENFTRKQMEEIEKNKRNRELVVYNKIDLVDRFEDFHNFLCVSAKTGQGLDILQGRLIKQLGLVNSEASIFSARRRHITAIESTLAHILRATTLIEHKSQSDMFAEELRLAQIALDSVTGAFSTDDLLGEIFNNFCIGK